MATQKAPKPALDSDLAVPEYGPLKDPGFTGAIRRYRVILVEDHIELTFAMSIRFSRPS